MLRKFLKNFKLDEYNELSTPMNIKEKLSKDDGLKKKYQAYYRSMIGYLMYLTTTRPDILNVLSILSRFMHFASEWNLTMQKECLDM